MRHNFKFILERKGVWSYNKGKEAVDMSRKALQGSHTLAEIRRS